MKRENVLLIIAAVTLIIGFYVAQTTAKVEDDPLMGGSATTEPSASVSTAVTSPTPVTSPSTVSGAGVSFTIK